MTDTTIAVDAARVAAETEVSHEIAAQAAADDPNPTTDSGPLPNPPPQAGEGTDSVEPGPQPLERMVDKLIGTYQCHAIYVPKYNRIDFHYTTSGNSNPTLLARYHINDQCWAPGVIGGTRCSGTHFQQGDTRVIAFDVDGYGYQHDNGNDANGSPLPWSLSLAPFALDKSLSVCEIHGLESDFKDQAGTITFTLATYDRLGDAAPEDSETETVSPGDQLIDWHSSGRYLSLAIASADLGSYFRWGVPQAYVKPLGLRR